jgi:hypothetical protein
MLDRFFYLTPEVRRQQGRLRPLAAESSLPASFTSGATFKKFSPILQCRVSGIAVPKHAGGRT